MLKKKNLVENSNKHTKCYTISWLNKKNVGTSNEKGIFLCISFLHSCYKSTSDTILARTCLCSGSSLLPERPIVHSHHRLALYEWKQKGNLTGWLTLSGMKICIFLDQVEKYLRETLSSCSNCWVRCLQVVRINPANRAVYNMWNSL